MQDVESSLSSVFLSTPSARRATSFVIERGKGGLKFLSTPSARRATFSAENWPKTYSISIHALREEGDWAVLQW